MGANPLGFPDALLGGGIVQVIVVAGIDPATTGSAAVGSQLGEVF